MFGKRKKRLIRKRYGALLIIVGIFYFGPTINGGFALTEHAAARYSAPNSEGEVVYEKKFGDKKVIIWDTGKQKFLKVIDNWGILHRVTNIDGINPFAEDGMKTNWSATQQEKKQHYKTVFSVEVTNENIVTVIVTNADLNNKGTSLEEVKEQSTIHVEMDVTNGYAAHYDTLPYSAVGNFVFRGLNKKGEVIAVSD
ncbi:hypothetical protein ACFO3D_12535 [Virgibacillus kekensis]|uniref:Uncharacterized protein n=1 Tax=Virgibacillus kekensis TaxID=202261 RepID=A0ABV9DM08_9BACI